MKIFPKARKLRFRNATRLPRLMLRALMLEGEETKEMVEIYLRQGRGKLLFFMKTEKPSPEELLRAKEQLKDLPRFLPFFVVIVVPAPGITEGYALLAVTLEKWLGHRFRLLPSQFRKVFEQE